MAEQKKIRRNKQIIILNLNARLQFAASCEKLTCRLESRIAGVSPSLHMFKLRARKRPQSIFVCSRHTPHAPYALSKHRRPAIYVARTFHAGAVRSFFSQLCQLTRRLVNSERRRRRYREWIPIDHASSTFLSPCLFVRETFCKNERIVAPLLGHQSFALPLPPPPSPFPLLIRSS